MEALRKQLRNELQKQPNIELISEDLWNLPMQQVEVPYTTFQRSTMDIVMKMILRSIQKLDIASGTQLAEFLSVEPLFIDHLMTRMQAARMLGIRDGRYVITETGKERLEAGIFESPPVEGKTVFYYSPCHADLFLGPEGEFPFARLEPYRWMKENETPVDELKRSRMIEALRAAEIERMDHGVQVLVDEIGIPECLEDLHIPCVEFKLHHRADDRRFARVWNTFLGEWDETLEKQVEERYG